MADAAIMAFIFALNLCKQDVRLPGCWLFLEPADVIERALQ